MKKTIFLRKKYPQFIYERYSYKFNKNALEIFFDFKTLPGISFRPKIKINGISNKKTKKEILNNLIFHLGLVEMISYWKATCSPKIEIKAGRLNKMQIKWWKDLIIRGMGQFFYENKINFREPGFLKIKADRNPVPGGWSDFRQARNPKNKILVPIGGGKDSIVTLEILKKQFGINNILCFSLNPTGPVRKIIETSGCKKFISVERKIDNQLLVLNQKGFLNGHTPFSAYLAFLSVLVAYLFSAKYIAFSNERSSNEGNLKYLGKIVNHQWSKSFEFEEKFREYSKKYLIRGIDYFSFLRPLYELQIAKIFSQYFPYFNSFLSCNVAFQTISGTQKPIRKWCGKCPKCLFIFTSLYPFIGKKAIKIFGKNLFQDKSLIILMLQLIGEKDFKPLECVGTRKESLVAFYLSWKAYRNRVPGKLPSLLRYFEKRIMPKYKNLEKDSKKILTSFNKNHKLPRKFESVLRKSLTK